MAGWRRLGLDMGDRIVSALDGRTLKWLSRRSGVPMQTLSNAMRHGSMMGADKAVMVARAMCVSVEWLVLGEEAPQALSPDEKSVKPESESAATMMLARLMPPAGSGNRMRWPSWYHDKPVLEAVLRTHRQAELDRVVEELQERFGTRAPTRSSLGRFWQRLDAMYRQARTSE